MSLGFFLICRVRCAKKKPEIWSQNREKPTANFFNFFICFSIWSRRASSSDRSNFVSISPLIFSKSFCWVSSWNETKSNWRQMNVSKTYVNVKFLHTIVDVLWQRVARAVKIFFQNSLIQIEFIGFLKVDWTLIEWLFLIFFNLLFPILHWQKFYPLCFDPIVGLISSTSNPNEQNRVESSFFEVTSTSWFVKLPLLIKSCIIFFNRSISSRKRWRTERKSAKSAEWSMIVGVCPGISLIISRIVVETPCPSYQNERIAFIDQSSCSDWI